MGPGVVTEAQRKIEENTEHAQRLGNLIDTYPNSPRRGAWEYQLNRVNRALTKYSDLADRVDGYY